MSAIWRSKQLGLWIFPPMHLCTRNLRCALAFTVKLIFRNLGTQPPTQHHWSCLQSKDNVHVNKLYLKIMWFKSIMFILWSPGMGSETHHIRRQCEDLILQSSSAAALWVWGLSWRREVQSHGSCWPTHQNLSWCGEYLKANNNAQAVDMITLSLFVYEDQTIVCSLKIWDCII